MMRMFRWSYLLPRLAVLFALLCLSEYGVAWLVKSAVRSSGESAVGARVDIAGSKASLLSTRVELTGLQVANPDAPLTNLVEADSVEVDFDASSLLRKQAVISHGSIRGLRFGGPRVASGALAESEPEEPSSPSDWAVGGPLADAAAERARTYLDQLGDRFTADLENQLQSVAVAKQLRQKWPAKYEEIAAAAKQLKADAEALKAQIGPAKKNPLRHAAFLQSVPARIAGFKSRLRQLNADLRALPGQIEVDRQAVAAARRHDEQLVRDTLRVENLDAESLTAYLVGEQVAEPVQQLVGWLRWVRQMAPAKVEPGSVERGRGVDVLFAGVERRPNLLVKSLDLSGTARVGGRPVELAGTLTDFTTEPKVHGEPLRLTINTTGALPIQMKATVDRTAGVARDELLADCNGLSTPRLELGGDAFGFAIEPSPATLSVSLLLDGDQLTGDVQLVQQQIQVATKSSVSGDSPVDVLNNAVATNLRQLSSMVTRVDLSGSLDQPEWGVWSNLGPAVAQAMESGLNDVVEQQSARLLAKSRQDVDAQLAAFDSEIAALKGSVGDLVNEPSGALEKLASELAGGSRFGSLGSRFQEATSQLR